MSVDLTAQARAVAKSDDPYALSLTTEHAGQGRGDQRRRQPDPLWHLRHP
jgi:hypothetical protein